ncbi:MAG: tyrosine-type recombinase/integrase [Firmicutes bacterium]|nr:tyrosine-type recombinase/integrase [Bacillota bacterium]
MSQINIHEIAERICEKLRGFGHRRDTVDDNFNETIRIALDIQSHGSMKITPYEIDNFIIRAQERVLSGEISAHRFANLRKVALRLIEFIETGDLVWKVHSRGHRKYPISIESEKIIAEYLSTLSSLCKKSKNRAEECCRLHLHWLEKHRKKLLQVTTDILKRYIVSSAERYSFTTVRAILSSLRRFYSHLEVRGLTKSDFRLILSSKVPPERKIKPALSRVEVSTVLNSINRTTAIGSRNYAILLLAAMTGLRAADILRLKLTDIDWRHGEIRIIQIKTKTPLTLPLTTEIGEAIKEYILKFRPNSDATEVFLKANAPYTGFTASGSIASMYESHFKAAGLQRLAGDGRSFHSLRRSMGLNMIVSNVPMTTAAQVLGQRNLSSTQQYISLNSTHLKECALDFSDIPLASRADNESTKPICNYHYVFSSEDLKDCALTFVGIELAEAVRW